MLSITGGFLFGAIWGTVHIVLSATLGATLLFLIAKTSLGNLLRATAGPWLQKMQAGFQENALSYLLVLRLVPLFPFFVVNLVPVLGSGAVHVYPRHVYRHYPWCFCLCQCRGRTREPLRCWWGIQCQRHPDATDPRGAYWLGSFSPDAGRIKSSKGVGQESRSNAHRTSPPDERHIRHAGYMATWPVASPCHRYL